jgi:hypothetical protein
VIFFAKKYRYVVRNQPMATPGNDHLAPECEGGETMEVLILLGVLGAWIILQVWVLPRLGVKT